MKFAIFSLLAIAFFVCGVNPAFASEVAEVVTQIAPAWTLTAATVLATAMQVLKHDISGGLLSKVKPWLQPVLVGLFGQIAAFVEVMSTGIDWKQAAVQWLFVSGGAMAIYDTVIKPITKK